MKGRALIFYHSASGNTRWVTDRLAAALCACGIETASRSIARKPDTSDLASYDLVGFGCPVMSFRPSFALSRFIRSLPLQTQTPAFIFTTYAGVLANTAWMLSNNLRDRGLVVVAHAHFKGEVSWPIARSVGLIVNRGLPGDTLLPAINGFAGSLAAELAEKHKTAVPPQPVDLPYSRLNVFHYIALLNSPAKLRAMMGTKRVNTALCTQCGWCEENCAAGAIALDPYPTFSRLCDGCWGCFNICPTGAISTIVGTHGRYVVQGTTPKPPLILNQL